MRLEQVRVTYPMFAMCLPQGGLANLGTEIVIIQLA